MEIQGDKIDVGSYLTWTSALSHVTRARNDVILLALSCLLLASTFNSLALLVVKIKRGEQSFKKTSLDRVNTMLDHNLEKSHKRKISGDKPGNFV